MKMLTQAALHQYPEQGYNAPIRIMPRAEADALRTRHPDADPSDRSVAYHAALTGAQVAIPVRDTGRNMRP